MEFISNMVLGLLLLGIVVAILIFLRKKHKRGEGTCGGNCGNCPMGGSCRKEEKDHPRV